MCTVPAPDDIRAWPATVDVPTAGSASGIGRDESYRLVHQGAFPVPVLTLGRYLRITRSSVLAALGLDDSLHSGRKQGRIDESRG